MTEMTSKETHVEFHETEETMCENKTENTTGRRSYTYMRSQPSFSEDSSFRHVANVNSTSVTTKRKKGFQRSSSKKNAVRFYCAFCNKSTFNEESLKSHVKLVHYRSNMSPRNTTRGKRKGPGIYRNDFDTEIDTRNDGTICDFSTPYKENLTFHVATTRSMSINRPDNMSSITLVGPKRNPNDSNTRSGENAARFHCTICDFSTLYKGILKKHAATLHSSSSPTKRLDLSRYQSGPRSKTSNQASKYFCTICDFSTLFKLNLKTHTATAHPSSKMRTQNTSPIIRQGLSKNPSSTSIQTSKKGPKFYCGICDFSTLYKGNLKTHSNTIHSNSKNGPKNAVRGKERFRKTFQKYSTSQSSNNSSPNDYKTNEFSTFRKGNAQSPSEMGPQETTSISIQNPNETTSLDGPRYYCTICDFSTLYKFNIRPHMNIHSKESKFMCSICDISFRSTETLQQHEILHFRSDPLLKEEPRLETEEIPLRIERSSDESYRIFSGGIRGHRFSRKRNFTRPYEKVNQLKNHVLKPKRIADSPDVSSEQRKIPWEGKFFCNICNKPFLFKRHLVLHLSNLKKNALPKFNKSSRQENQNQMFLHLDTESSEKVASARAQVQFPIEEFIHHQSSNAKAQLIGKKSFFCKLCGSGYTRKYNLTSHIAHCHRESILTRKSDTTMRTRQSSGRSYGRQRHRNLSSIRSTNGKFLCEFCDSSFIQIARLLGHVETFHKDTSPQVDNGSVASDDDRFSSIDGVSAVSLNIPVESKVERNALKTNQNDLLDSFEPFSDDCRDSFNEGLETQNEDVPESVNNHRNEEDLELEEVDLNVIVQKYLMEDFDLEFGKIPLNHDNRATLNNASQKLASSDYPSNAMSEEPQYLGKKRRNAVHENRLEIQKLLDQQCSDGSQRQENRNPRKGLFYVNRQNCSETDEGTSTQKNNLRQIYQRRLIQEISVERQSNAPKYVGLRKCSVKINPLPTHYSSYVTNI